VHVDFPLVRWKLQMNARSRRSLNPGLALLIALWVALALPALSVAQSPPASDPPRISPPPEANVAPAPASETKPPDNPPPPDTTPAQAAAPPPRKGPWLALVLPLESPTYARAATAVREGFAAAANEAGVDFAVVSHVDGDARAAIEKAQAAGARVIVGPLVRDDVKAIADFGGRDAPWIIALNQIEEGVAISERVYTLALGIDGEARQLARRARQAGAQSVVVLASDSPLQKRFAEAFVSEWLLAGGGPPRQLRFDRAPELLSVIRREVGRAVPDAILLAVDAGEAAVIKPYLGKFTVYTSSQVNDRQARENLLDLDNVFFVEIPWIADPGSTTFARIARREYPNAAFDRLFALGIDAFRVAQVFGERGPPERLELDGATGHLSLEPSHQFSREAMLMQFRAGAIVPAGTR